ncbi:hypothetical protein IQ273_32425 [Nodosilinea sp. LEGE 07298]|uniref:hypothetical protein n=1 Tax=Nodosilinea sp. LEGE 07298 TaxID=2777970 RepID=UPI0018813563|nr:hypothetical protein [Nodosilinea sp. LEGE 07298]MBE9114072.1 hypothetical protein [Nodosilinea sp. LEGE 07298]
MSAFSLDAVAGSEAPQPWLKETVQAFFEAVAWDGRAALATPSLGGTTHSESAMTMTVSDFFENIAWDGQPTIGVPISPLEAVPATSSVSDLDLTLDGFSDLFG